jgi:hypothetical protein
MIAQLVALVLALAKALPAIERLVAEVETRRREAKAAELHHAIDEAIEKARHSAPFCPHPDCPMRRGVLRDTGGVKPSGATDETP